MIKIGSRPIGEGYPCYIIAEAGVGHGGDLETAKHLAMLARSSGAHAVKFQTFNTDLLVTKDAPAAPYQRDNGGWETQYEALKAVELTPMEWAELATHTRTMGIDFLSTPFDEDSVDLLDELGVPAFKVGSGELTNLDLLEYIAGLRKPLLVSTGMATLGEIEQAVSTIRWAGNDQLLLMHCHSAYPTKAKDVNLRAMETLRRAFQVPVGFSDHTTSLAIPIAAVALGASVIEKHFRLEDDLGPDSATAIIPWDFYQMVACVCDVEEAMGTGVREPSPSELEMRQFARRHRIATQDIKAGDPIEASNSEMLRHR